MVNYPPDSASSAFGQMAGNVVVFLHLNHLRDISIADLSKAPVTGMVHSQKTYPTVNSSERVSIMGVPKT
jgi:hypothetical protein